MLRKATCLLHSKGYHIYYWYLNVQNYVPYPVSRHQQACCWRLGLWKVFQCASYTGALRWGKEESLSLLWQDDIQSYLLYAYWTPLILQGERILITKWNKNQTTVTVKYNDSIWLIQLILTVNLTQPGVTWEAGALTKQVSDWVDLRVCLQDIVLLKDGLGWASSL